MYWKGVRFVEGLVVLASCYGCAFARARLEEEFELRCLLIVYSSYCGVGGE